MKKNTIPTHITEETIRKLGGCKYAISVFNMFNAGEEKPSIDKICDEISTKGELSKHGAAALLWLKSRNFLGLKNIYSILKKQNKSSGDSECSVFQASPKFWLNIADNWNDPTFIKEMMKLFDSSSDNFPGSTELGFFFGAAGGKQEIETILTKIPKSRRDNFFAAYILSLLAFSDLSADEADKKAKMIKKMGITSKISDEMHDIIKYGFPDRIQIINLFLLLNKIDMPAFKDFVADKVINLLLKQAFSRTKIENDLVMKIKEIVGNLEKYNIKNILIEIFSENYIDQEKLEQLVVLKKHEGIKLCDVNWRRFHIKDEEKLNKATLKELYDLVESEVKLLDEPPNEDAIPSLINFSDEVRNSLGEIFLKHAYKDDAATRRIEMINKKWLLRISEKTTLSADEKHAVKNIDPLCWLDLLIGYQLQDTYSRCAKILIAYPPVKKLPLSQKMRTYTRPLYEQVAREGGMEFVEALAAAGYKLPKMGLREIKFLLLEYADKLPMEKQLNDVRRIIKILPIKENCSFPVKFLQRIAYYCRDDTIFRFVFFNELRERGVGIQETDLKFFAGKIRELIDEGFLYYWRELVKLPKDIYAKELLVMIKYENQKNKAYVKKLQKEVQEAVETPEIFGDEQNLHKAYLYLVKTKVLTASYAISKIGKVNFFTAKYKEMGDVYAWYKIAKEAGILSSELCMEIIDTINENPVNKKSVLCLESIVKDLFDGDHKVILDNAREILICYERVFSKFLITKKSANMLRQLALSNKTIANYFFIEKLLSCNAYQEVLKKWQITNSNSLKSSPSMYRKLSRL